jgi:hypothetical protein
VIASTAAIESSLPCSTDQESSRKNLVGSGRLGINLMLSPNCGSKLITGLVSSAKSASFVQAEFAGEVSKFFQSAGLNS